MLNDQPLENVLNIIIKIKDIAWFLYSTYPQPIYKVFARYGDRPQGNLTGAVISAQVRG
jgi:hypothetical protein